MDTQKIRVSTKSAFITALRCAYNTYDPNTDRAVDTDITLILKSGKEVKFYIFGHIFKREFQIILRNARRLPAVDFLAG